MNWAERMALEKRNTVLLSGLKYSTQLIGVNGFDPFIKRSEEVLKSTQEISIWFKKIALIYETNGKALVKSASLTKKKKMHVAIEIGSLSGAWRAFHAQLELLGDAQLACARDLQIEVSDKIASFVLDKTNVRKKLVGEVNKVTTDLKNVLALLQKARSNYESKCKDADGMQQAYFKAKQDGNIKPKRVQELQGRFNKAMDTANQAEMEYRKALDKANAQQNRHYETEMPSILEMFQAFEEERLSFLKDMFSLAAAIQNNLPPISVECAHQMIGASQDVTAVGDINEYIEENSTSIVPPAPLEFMPYETDNVHFKLPESESRSTDAPRHEQYGLTEEQEALSDEEKIKLLQSQLNDLHTLILEEIAAIKGIKKLIRFYAEDQSQEKAKAELEAQISKIRGLEQTKISVEQKLFAINPSLSLEGIPDGVSQQFPTARALYTYAAIEPSELSFQSGDVLVITEQDKSGWWLANLGNKMGFIPRNYVTLL